MERLQVSAYVTHHGVDAGTPAPPDFSWWFTQLSGQLGAGLVFPGALITPLIMDSGGGPTPAAGPERVGLSGFTDEALRLHSRVCRRLDPNPVQR